MNDTELKQVIEFMKETDKLKSVYRRTKLSQEDRFEDGAQHSWHTALFAILLKDHLKDNIDYTKFLEMAIIHDLVEIYSGDVFAFDEENQFKKFNEEKESAKKLFELLPKELNLKFHSLNDEYMNRETTESIYLSAINKTIPSIQNKITNYYSWKEFNISNTRLEEFFKVHCEIDSNFKQLIKIIKEDIKDFKNK